MTEITEARIEAVAQKAWDAAGQLPWVEASLLTQVRFKRFIRAALEADARWLAEQANHSSVQTLEPDRAEQEVLDWSAHND